MSHRVEDYANNIETWKIVSDRVMYVDSGKKKLQATTCFNYAQHAKYRGRNLVLFLTNEKIKFVPENCNGTCAVPIFDCYVLTRNFKFGTVFLSKPCTVKQTVSTFDKLTDIHRETNCDIICFGSMFDCG